MGAWNWNLWRKITSSEKREEERVQVVVTGWLNGFHRCNGGKSLTLWEPHLYVWVWGDRKEKTLTCVCVCVCVCHSFFKEEKSVGKLWARLWSCALWTHKIILWCVTWYVLNLASTFGFCVNELCSPNSQSIVKLHKRAGLSFPGLAETELKTPSSGRFLPLVEV